LELGKFRFQSYNVEEEMFILRPFSKQSSLKWGICPPLVFVDDFEKGCLIAIFIQAICRPLLKFGLDSMNSMAFPSHSQIKKGEGGERMQ
jgi:hypothetical protein